MIGGCWRHLTLIAVLIAAAYGPEIAGRTAGPDHWPAVFARFDLGAPEGGPFPSDVFTVPDPRQATGRRLSHPYPDCTERPSDCEDLDVVNTLDGWGLHPRISVPFSGAIDPTSVTSETLFVIGLDTRPGRPLGGERIGINQVVWDVATNTLHVEVDRLLNERRRYAVIVTTGIRDTRGRAVKRTDTFKRFVTMASSSYAAQLRDALAGALAAGVPPGHVAAASVFTTQTITSVMERIRDDIKADTPAPADFQLGPAGERAVFSRTGVSSVVFRQQTGANPTTFTDAAVNLALLDVNPGAVGTIAYGRYSSPEYLVRPGEYIPAVGTLAETPPVQRYADVYFTLYLPAGPKPSGGWPVVIVGVAATQHMGTTIWASSLASQGLATIGISQLGEGFGPLGRLAVTGTDGTTLDLPNAGRGADQNGDDVYGAQEGGAAAAPRAWTISVRDTNRQMVIDLLQLVRVIEIGMDVDGDFVADIHPGRIAYQGISGGAFWGMSFVALEPAVATAGFSVPPGFVPAPEHVRWIPARRSGLGASLQARVPSLINAPGLTAIDGVATAAPHFDENKPLRDQPPVVNTIRGAIEIQHAFEFAEMAREAGTTVPWARHLRADPLPGSYPKAILLQMARGDQTSVNPGTSMVVREGQLADSTTLYRHDLAFAAHPTMPKNPHLFTGQLTSPNATVRTIALGAQEQIAVFFATLGATIIHPSPAQWFEVPINGDLPETLGFIR
jgi:hypothetical protein